MIETNSEILCTLVSRQINPIKFQIQGINIHWLVAPSQSEIDIYSNIKANYETLKTQYLAEQQAIKQAKAQDIINNLPSWQQVSDAIDNATTLNQVKVIFKKLCRVVYWLAKDSQT